LSSLKKKSGIALAWDFGSLLLNKGSGFIISIFLARLLSPEEFGLVGMAMVFIAIFQVFVDVGFSSSIIQRTNCTPLTYSSVFYFNIFSGLILTCLFYSVAPYIGSFYNNIEVTKIVQWLSLSFILNSFNQVQIAILKKDLNFKLLSIRTVFASLFGGVLGVVAAFHNYGVYSLVIQSLSTAVLSTVLLWSVSNWKPSFLFSWTELKSLSGFSIYVFLDRLTSMIIKKLDVFFIGKVFSPSTLGFYTRAESLNSQITTYTSSSVIKVFFPVLSSLKDNDEEFKRVYFKVISLICFLSFILSGLLYVMAEPLILGLFGEKWLSSVVIFQILVFKSFNVPLNAMMLNALLGKGMAKENFKIGLVRKILRASPIFVGLYYGLIPFVWSITAISFFLSFFNIVFIKRYLGIGIIYHVRKILEGVIPFLILVILSHTFQIQSLAGKTCLSICYLIGYFLYASFIKMEGWLFFRKELLKRINR